MFRSETNLENEPRNTENLTMHEDRTVSQSPVSVSWRRVVIYYLTVYAVSYGLVDYILEPRKTIPSLRRRRKPKPKEPKKEPPKAPANNST